MSGIYCDKLTVKKYWDNSPASHWNTSLYLLYQMPNLSTAYNFIVSENITLSANEFYKWSFYLNDGSSYTIKACKVNGADTDDVQVCVIGGDKNLNDWIRTRSCENSHSIKLCNSSGLVQINATYSKVIKESNSYYFVYSTQNEIEASLQVDVSFISLEYSVERNIFLECTILSIADEDQSCVINIPTNFSGAAAVATSAPLDDPTVWMDTLPVSWECEAPMNSFQIYMFFASSYLCVIVFPLVAFIDVHQTIL